LLLVPTLAVNNVLRRRRWRRTTPAAQRGSRRRVVAAAVRPSPPSLVLLLVLWVRLHRRRRGLSLKPSSIAAVLVLHLRWWLLPRCSLVLPGAHIAAVRGEPWRTNRRALPSDPHRGTTAHCPSVIVVSDALALAVCASRSARSPVARSAAPTIAKAPRATAMSVAIHRSLALLPLPPPV
tara:strand:- start:175 stop:714 length:540 start_codon:yes stop_codon:yes gene_type:complete